MQAENIKDKVVSVLDDLKAQNIVVLDVRGLTTIADYMVVASGTSARHVTAMSSKLVDALKEVGHRALGTEGEVEGDWVLVDLGDVIVHIMLPQTREFYKLESLWDVDNREEREQA